MHIYFSGIGGAGIGPLALIAKQAGFVVSGSDKKNSPYIELLKENGIQLHIGQTKESIAAIHKSQAIDWIVMSSAVPIENPDHPELIFAKEQSIKISKRDEFLNVILQEKNLKLIAISGTHGKTTTTAMAIWTLQQLGIPISYSIGAKIQFGDMGHYNADSEYFVYECDEFDRNFLSFSPFVSVITTIDWDHHEIYPTIDNYKQAFRQFIDQSNQTVLYKKDFEYINLAAKPTIQQVPDDDFLLNTIKLAGAHNRKNGLIIAHALSKILNIELSKIIAILEQFPGSARRFEMLAPNIYTDYAHTPEEISATIQMAQELNPNVVVVYEPLTNRRQHYMKDKYRNIFESVKKVYWLPSYLAREDPSQHIYEPKELIECLSDKTNAVAAKQDDELLNAIKNHATHGELVLCMAGGGGRSLDDFLRENIAYNI
jgi:UDP-N-acetylmuramate--alanine ligase